MIAVVTAVMTNRPIRLAFGLPILAPSLLLTGSLLLAASVLLASPGAALASCVMLPPVDNAAQTADIVFVGTVSATSNGNRWAEVAVQEVWRGPDMPKTVVIQGGPAGNTMTSVDRSFQVGVTYLFFPYVDPATGALADNSCTGTTEFTDDLVRLRPADARQPLGGDPAETAGGFDVQSLLPVGLALAVFGVLLVVGLVARGRQEG